MAKRNVEYIVINKYKTDKSNLADKEFKEIFNKKLLRYIIKNEMNLNNNENEKKEVKKNN